MVVLCFSAPCSLMQTTLQPVLKPGSIPRILFAPNGGASNNSFAFLANTLIASRFLLASFFSRGFC